MSEKQFDGKKILIVDDDPEILTSLEVLLEDTGATILKAADGAKAVDIGEAEDLDLVILDAMLPKMSGFLVLEKLKKGGRRGDKPFVIMITGNQGKRHQAYAESRGADVYMNKPFRMEKLLQSMEALLNRDA